MHFVRKDIRARYRITSGLFSSRLASNSPVSSCWHNAKLFIELFSNSGSLLKSFTREQLEQGFWAIQGPVLPESLPNLIWGSNISVDLKSDLIHSMYKLFRDFFSYDELETSCNMFFSCMINMHGWNSQLATNFKENIINHQLFSTLSLILSFESDACQGAALLGLCELNHPLTSELIKSYLSAHPEFSEDEVEDIECIFNPGPRPYYGI
jgi:hypothetical protein